MHGSLSYDVFGKLRNGYFCEKREIGMELGIDPPRSRDVLWFMGLFSLMDTALAEAEDGHNNFEGICNVQLICFLLRDGVETSDPEETEILVRSLHDIRSTMCQCKAWLDRTSHRRRTVGPRWKHICLLFKSFHIDSEMVRLHGISTYLKSRRQGTS